MKCKIVLIALIAVLSRTIAVTVDHYPQDNHHYAHHPGHDHYPHDHHYAHHSGHVKYVEPAHHAVKYVEPSHHALKYVQQPPVAPLFKSIAPAPVKYVHQEPAHQVKYLSNPHLAKHVEYDEPVNYEFGYSVQDEITGDVKSHSEKRDGHAVQGRYELLDSDGFKRVVEYTADDHNGFNAVVTRIPVDHAPVVKKVYQPEIVKPAPVKYFNQPQPTVVKSYVSEPYQHQKVIAPVVKHLPQPAYYAPPEHPKFFKPVEKVAKFVKPAYEYEPHHTDVKYVHPAPHYTHY